MEQKGAGNAEQPPDVRYPHCNILYVGDERKVVAAMYWEEGDDARLFRTRVEGETTMVCDVVDKNRDMPIILPDVLIKGEPLETLEERYPDVQFWEEEVGRFQSVGDTLNYIESELKGVKPEKPI